MKSAPLDAEARVQRLLGALWCMHGMHVPDPGKRFCLRCLSPLPPEPAPMLDTRCETCTWWDPIPDADQPTKLPREGVCHSRSSEHAMKGKPTRRSWVCVWWERELVQLGARSAP